MDFKDILNNYIEILNCSSKDLAEASNLSSSVLSYYRNGNRIPNFESEQFKALVSGIITLAQKSNLSNITKESVVDEFAKTYGKNIIDFEIVRKNFNEIISLLDINISKMSRSLGFDASYISRVRSGERKPSDSESFVLSICEYIVKSADRNKVSELLNLSVDELDNKDNYLSNLENWFYTNIIEDKKVDVSSFLEKLNQFNLEEYIKVIHFDELKVPQVPFHFPIARTYTGLDELKAGELDFFKSTVLSKNMDDVLMYNDMPVEDMAEDLDFGKKWMFAIAMSLKKGLHLNEIHNLNRPFNELLIGLESWIPIYMTGQVSPYYLKDINDSYFYHTLYVSGSAALNGEGIVGHHNNSKYYLTNKKSELDYYKEKAKNLLKKATPLMKIYDNKNMEDFNEFIKCEKNIKDNKIIELENDHLKTTFNNIKFTVCENKWILVSKKNNPEINFVIYHPVLRDAIINFITPITENTKTKNNKNYEKK